MFGFSRERTKIVKLDRFLRDRIAEAERDFDRAKPGLFTFERAKSGWFGSRSSKPKNWLALHPILVQGFSHALRAIFVAGAPPAGVIHMTAANVVIDKLMDYHHQTPMTLNSNKALGVSTLSFNIISDESVSDNFKDNVAKIRHALQAAIFATAEYVEMEQLVSLADALKADVDPNKKKQIGEFINSQYKFHVSYRSMAIALQLFASVNQEMLIRMKKINKSDRFKALAITNVVFVYEIADLIIAFINAFSLQGVKELRKIHEDVISEIEFGRAENENMLARVKARQDSQRQSMLNLEIEAKSAKGRLSALVELERVWAGMMKKVDDAETGVYSFKNCIDDLEIIKAGAVGNLRILDLVSVTRMVETNINAMEAMLQIERLQLPPMTSDDVLRFLGLERDDMNRDGEIENLSR